MKVIRVMGCATAIVVALGVFVATPAPAKAEPSASVRTVQAAPEKIPSEHVKSFAKAANKVFQIKQEYAPKVQAAANEADARALITAAQDEMLKAIEGEGLSVERYNQIIQAAQNDPELMSEIQKLVDGAQ